MKKVKKKVIVDGQIVKKPFSNSGTAKERSDAMEEMIKAHQEQVESRDIDSTLARLPETLAVIKLDTSREFAKVIWKFVELVRAINGIKWNEIDQDDLDTHFNKFYASIKTRFIEAGTGVPMPLEDARSVFSTLWDTWDEQKMNNLTRAAYNTLMSDWRGTLEVVGAVKRFKFNKPDRTTLIHLCYQMSALGEKGVFFLGARDVVKVFHNFFGIEFSIHRAASCLMAFRNDKRKILELVDKGSGKTCKANTYRWVFDEIDQ